MESYWLKDCWSSCLTINLNNVKLDICVLPKSTLSCWFLFEIAAHHTSFPWTTGLPGPSTLDEAKNSAFMFSAISDGQPEKTTAENYVLLIKVHLTLKKVFFNGTEKFILLFPLKCDFLWISLNSLCPGWIQAPKAIWDLGIESMRCNVGTRKTLKRNYVSSL